MNTQDSQIDISMWIIKNKSEQNEFIFCIQMFTSEAYDRNKGLMSSQSGLKMKGASTKSTWPNRLG